MTIALYQIMIEAAQRELRNRDYFRALSCLQIALGLANELNSNAAKSAVMRASNFIRAALKRESFQ